MTRTIPILTMFLFLASSAAVRADAVPKASRGFTLDQWEWDLGFDFTLGLNKGQVAEAYSIGHGEHGGFYALARSRNPAGYPAIPLFGYEHDRHAGFTIAYGVLDSLEVGVAINAINYSRLHDEYGTSTLVDTGGVDLYVTYGFLPFIGVELGLLVPGADFDNKRVGMRIGVPIEANIVEDILTIFLREDIEFFFVEGGPTIETFTDVGLTINPVPEMFIETFVGYRYGIHRPTGADRLPLGIKIGVSPLDPVDIGLAFTFGDLINHGADARSLTLSGSIRL